MSELAAAYEHLPPQAAALLRGLVVLDLRSVTVPAAAAILDVPEDAASGALGELAERGWLVPGCHRWDLATTELTAPIEPAEVVALATRFVDYSLPDAGDDICAAVAVVVRHDAAGAVSLALHVWRQLGEGPAQPWWQRLAAVGEEAAIAGRAPGKLVDLLIHSGVRFADAGERVTAEAQWVRALALVEQLGEHDRFAAVLILLADLYRGWGRLHRAMDVLFELVAVRRDHFGPIEVAEALEKLGNTMSDARRPDSAAYYLSEADELLSGIKEITPSMVRRHASILIALGQAREQQGAIPAAKRAYSRALAMVTDVDEDAAERARGLLAAAARR